MPTPVTAARQCLTPEAEASLDDAVAVARRRGHVQTTSLHMVYALLSLPNSSLREACARARAHNAAYSARVQFKALDLSLTVSLDRMPSNSQNRSDGEPPVSNSLMAAIKRSQANQRRQPENYTFYHHQKQQHHQYPSSSSSPPCSSSIPVVKVELQNLIISILDDPLVSRVFGEAGFRNFDIKMAVLRKGSAQVFGCTSRYKRSNPPLFLCNFPVAGGGFSGSDESTRRVGEIMRRGKKKCPLLLGVSAADALKVFLEKISTGDKGVVLGDGLGGVRVVCVKDEIFRCLSGKSEDGPLRSKLEEVERAVGGKDKVVVSFGDLKEFSRDCVDSESLRFLVRKLSELVEVYGGSLWLIGFAANYEVYFKVLEKMPAIEEGWDLEVLPIPSFMFSVGGSYPRSSLMESFVPLGGFFPMPQEMKSPPSSNACQIMVRCHLCNEKYEQEVAALSNGEHLRDSVGQPSQSSLPSWLQSPAQPGPWSGSSSVKSKDDSLLMNAKITGLQRKWDGICQQHHFGQTFLKGYQIPRFQVAGDRKQNESNNSSNNSNQSSKEQGNENLSIVSRSVEITLEPKDEAGADKSPPSFSLNAGTIDSHRSPTSVTSVTTDLGLGMISKCPSQSSSCNHEVKDPKSIYKVLVERVAHQEEAIRVIVDTITKVGCQNVWINIRGADRLGKRKLGLAIAETLYGTNESLIYADLSFQNGMTPTESLFDRHMVFKYDLTMRGTVVDYLVEKLSKNPSVIFLENIDKADQVVQNSLLQALKTGRLTDLRGREVNISNCIFLGTTKYSGDTKGKKYTEEDVLMAKGGSIQMTIGFDLNDDPTDKNPPRFPTKKRKLVGKSTGERALRSKSCLDLNLPVSSEPSDSWAEDFDGRMHRVVDFEPLDFDGLAERVLGEISLCLGNVGGCECSVEVEPDVIRQVLAGAYLFGNKRVEDWVRSVVSEAFSEAMGKYGVDGRSIVKIGRYDGDGSDEVLLPERILIK